MAELLFSLDGEFNRHAHNVLSDYNNSAHFKNEPLAALPHGELRMQVEHCADLPYPLSAHTTWSRYGFRRTRAHIREDRSQFCIVNYIERGKMRIIQGGCEAVADAGSFAILSVSEPFTVECIPDEDYHRALYFTCSTDDVARNIPAFSPSTPLAVGGGKVAAAGKMLDMLYCDGELMDDRAFKSILDAMFCQIAVNSGEGNKRLSANDLRLRDIEAYLSLHLGRQGLCLADLSQDLGLSVRYITRLFQQRETSFGKTLWTMRVDKVREWLEMPDRDDRTIAELAYAAGFKSAPHLSNMFQEKFGLSPREFRQQRIAPTLACAD